MVQFTYIVIMTIIIIIIIIMLYILMLCHVTLVSCCHVIIKMYNITGVY